MMLPLSLFQSIWRWFGRAKSVKPQGTASGQDAGRALRLMVLQTSPNEFGWKPTPERPHVYGVMMDWPVDTVIVSVVSLLDGTTSLYTTGTFGLIGGGVHESVRRASNQFLQLAEACYADAGPTHDFGYPTPDRMRFYLLCYDGLRMIEDTQEAFRRGRDQRAAIAAAAQEVVSALRELQERPAPGT